MGVLILGEGGLVSGSYLRREWSLGWVTWILEFLSGYWDLDLGVAVIQALEVLLNVGGGGYFVADDPARSCGGS